MGAGLAKKFAKKYPNYLADYKVACVLNQIRIGMVAVSISSVTKAPYTIISLPTKKHYSEKSDLQDIADALVSMISQHRMNYFSAEHIAVPAIGCGLGGLVWDDVLHIIRAASIFSKVPFHVYPPQ
jgi:O-acetyl-ADP-ribose deacetylase (regulator of RNase III)